MWTYSHYKTERDRKRQIVALNATIQQVYEDERSSVENAKTDEEKQQAQTIINAMTEDDREKLILLEQLPLYAKARKAGIDIPDKYEDRMSSRPHPVLSYEGEAWLRRELKIRWKTEVKDWIAIIHPIVSWIFGLLGLLLAFKSQHGK